jgi:asparagine synthase (glutamine-hydrolysing)
MCGIAGILSSTMGRDELEARLLVMRHHLRHRGPDDCGVYLDDRAPVGLAHTRLAILDLSPAGHQPMSTDDGRYTIVFNGEIYNYSAVREELEAAGAHFRSHGDTEVILHAYRLYGENCVERFVGMYAFAIWDRLEHTCFLARGPMGIKPLYVWRRGDRLAFASEVRSVLAADLGPRRLCSQAMRGYLLYGSVQDPLTLVEGVENLLAGHSLTWRDGRVTMRRFYDDKFTGEITARDEAVALARQELLSSVDRHFVSDVPVDIFLSGGIDSTAIVALARAGGREDLHTYCISFDEAEFNEGAVAARSAAQFGARHVDLRMTATDARELFPKFLDSLDQPSTDGFNTFCVARLARQQGAKVVLSGLGGDELFGGYPSFRDIPRLQAWQRNTAAGGRRVQKWLGRTVERVAHQGRWRRAGVFLQSQGDVAAAYWTMRGIFTPQEADRLIAHYLGAAQVGFGDSPFDEDLNQCPSDADAVSHLEFTHYMQNQLLRDSDVMSMAWGLELRVPFVDRRLVGQMRRIAAPLRLAPGKQLVVDAVPELPSWVVHRPKQGFSFPFQSWLSGEWEPVFARLDERSPVSLATWYRRWCLFTLEHFLRVNRIDCDADVLVA